MMPHLVRVFGIVSHLCRLENGREDGLSCVFLVIHAFINFKNEYVFYEKNFVLIIVCYFGTL